MTDQYNILVIKETVSLVGTKQPLQLNKLFSAVFLRANLIESYSIFKFLIICFCLVYFPTSKSLQRLDCIAHVKKVYSPTYRFRVHVLIEKETKRLKQLH